jgi:hypothetical protein
MKYGDLELIRHDIATYMPKYNIKKIDPLESLEGRVGNCFAKAVIAGGIAAVRHSAELSVAYSDRLHATIKPSMLSGSQAKNYAHIALLAPNEATGDVMSLCFGIEGKSGKKVLEFDEGDILDYNESEQLAQASPALDRIGPTETAIALGLYVGDWREGADRYMTALERPPIKFDQLLERIEEIFE